MAGNKTKRVKAIQRQVRRIETHIAILDQVSRRFSRGRLGLVAGFLLGAVVVNFAGAEDIAWGMLGLGVVLFLIVARLHERVEASLRKHQVWRQIKRTHLARMTLGWEDLPPSTLIQTDDRHPFDADLGITGAMSLFRLMDTSTSQGGSIRLSQWLLNPLTEPDQIRTRQTVVKALIPLTKFRDRLTLYGQMTDETMDQRWDGETILQWLAKQVDGRSLKPFVLLLSLLSLTTISLYTLHQLIQIPAWWWWSFIPYVVIYLGLYSTRSGAMDSLDEDATLLTRVLKPFRATLTYLESYPLSSTPQVESLCGPFRSAGHRPSLLLKQLDRIAGGASWQKGQVLWLILNALVPWDLYFTHRLQGFRREVKDHLPEWLDAWYELEAFSALATFGYLNPDTVFPDVKEASDLASPIFETHALGHPFLPDKARVCHNYTIQETGNISIITGSNMSGKSTFLRTLGVNFCLAFTGGPVLARLFTTIPFRLFTCIKVSDSVTDGVSYFYAEVKRLKALLNVLETEGPPLFFLIDEIFRGTNNRERLIGSQAYIRNLAAHKGTGCISTHDLDLVNLAQTNSGIRNYHFKEEIRDGIMVFDYLLHEGPCPTTNALRIMEIEGLSVEEVPISG
jgi:hypothetical protein